MSHLNPMRNIQHIEGRSPAEDEENELAWPMVKSPSTTPDAIRETNIASSNISLRDVDSTIKVLESLGHRFSH